MAEFGGVRFDFTVDYNLTPGENRPVRFRVKDKDGVDIPSFFGWTFEWFIRRSQRDGNGLDALRNNPVVFKADGDITKTAPYLDVSLVPEDFPRPANYWHELWRTDDGNEERLSFGDVVVGG